MSNTELLGKHDKIIVDFRNRKDKFITLSISKDDNLGASIGMDIDGVKDLINTLQNPPKQEMVEVENDCHEIRSLYRYFDVMNMEAGAVRSRIGIGYSKITMEIRLQVDYKNTKKIGYVRIPVVETEVLIGILYLWLANTKISVRTIQSLFNNNGLKCNSLEINNTYVPICYNT